MGNVGPSGSPGPPGLAVSFYHTVISSWLQLQVTILGLDFDPAGRLLIDSFLCCDVWLVFSMETFLK